jgi:TP901 family phage tail tape measure protein
VATQFDAVARISLDIRAFANGANQVTRSGGVMERAFKNLHNVMNQVDIVEKKLAADLSRSLRVYSQIANVANQYARAVQTLAKNQQQGQSGAKLMGQALEQLSKTLSKVRGLSEKEAQRLSRTISLYERMANVVKTLAQAQAQMSGITQNQQKLDQAAAREKQRAAEASQKLALSEQRLATTRQQALNTSRQLSIAQQRLAQQQQKVAEQNQRLATTGTAAANAMTRMSASSFALRSSLGELESAYQGIFKTLTAIPTALATAGISQEAAFAQVARVVGEANAESVGLLESFRDIAATFPISFEEVARIGQLGAQIGVSASELDQFTRTVARFSLTTGIAAEESTILLGRIAEMQDVPISELENLGSAILALGTASAATDQEILRVNESIATVSNVFGLTTEATSGLSAALATLRVRPELSRGSLTRVFGELDEAVNNGGDALERLSQVMGMTAEDVVNLRRTDPDQFFLAFVKGLQTTAGPTKNFQAAIRSLGINAVRDIDTFTRLGNNFEVLAGAVDMAYIEYAKGSELQRQSKGIFETTQAELQNLSDGFGNLLAQLGGPLIEIINTWASALTTFIEFIGKLGPIVPILGGIISTVAILGAAWAGMQLIMSRLVQGFIAMAEVKQNLQVRTITLGTVMDAYRGKLGQTTAATSQLTAANTQLAASSASLATSMARSNATLITQGKVAASAAQATAVAARTQNAAVQQAAATSTAFATGTAALTTGLVAANNASRQAASGFGAVSAATLNSANSAARLATTSQILATGLGASAVSAAAMNRSTALLVPNTAGLSTNMARAATAGSAMGAGMTSAAVASGTLTSQLARTSGAALATNTAINSAAAGATRAATSFSLAAAGARLMAFAVSPLGLTLGVLAITMGPLLVSMIDFTSESDKLANSAREAAGGSQALTNAIIADTKAVQEGATSYGSYRTSVSSLSDVQREAAEREKEKAEATIASITALRGSVDNLKAQAQGQDASAQSAKRYLREIDAANQSIDRANEALSEHTIHLGEQARAFAESTGRAILNESGILKNADALKQLESTGINLGEILTESLRGPEGADNAINKLREAHEKLQKTISSGIVGTGSGVYIAQTSKDAEVAQQAVDAFSKAIQDNKGVIESDVVANRLLQDALAGVGIAASAMGGKIELTKQDLEEMDSSAEEAQKRIDSLTKSITEAANPLEGYEQASESWAASISKDTEQAESAVTKFSLTSAGGLDAYIKKLEEMAKAQRDWAKNIATISSTLGPDIAAMFEAEGPKAAKAVADLANLSADELKKLKPRLEAVMGDNIAGISAAITANEGKVTNKGAEIGQLFGNAVANAMKRATAPGGDIIQASQGIDAIGDAISKKIITPKVALDITAVQGDAAKLEAYILQLVNSGKLDIEAAATLTTALYQGEANELSAWVQAKSAVGAFDANGDAKIDTQEYAASLAQMEALANLLTTENRLDAEGKGVLSTEEFNRKLGELQGLILLGEKAELFDPDGAAGLNPGPYQGVLDALKLLAKSGTTTQGLSPTGSARLNPDIYNRALETLKGGAQRWKKAVEGLLSPSASVDDNQFNTDLSNMRQSSYTTGQTISRNLSTSATVSVGYYYYQKNSPPSTAQAATGGWIAGPGTGTSDSIPAMLSDGEFVINAKQAGRFGALLEAINDGRYGKGYGYPAGFASGGSVNVRRVNLRQMSVGSGMIQRMPANSMVPRMTTISGAGGPQITVNNQYPQAEPTSTTINRSLAYAATLNGV